MTDEEKEKFKLHWELLQNSIWERYKSLPTVSSLAATLLVVATFNKELLPITAFVKILLTVLLILIPVPLIGYLYELRKAENKIRAKLGIESFPHMKISIMNYFPQIILAILTIVVIFIIFLIWHIGIKFFITSDTG